MFRTIRGIATRAWLLNLDNVKCIFLLAEFRFYSGHPLILRSGTVFQNCGVSSQSSLPGCGPVTNNEQYRQSLDTWDIAFDTSTFVQQQIFGISTSGVGSQFFLTGRNSTVVQYRSFCHQVYRFLVFLQDLNSNAFQLTAPCATIPTCGNHTNNQHSATLTL